MNFSDTGLNLLKQLEGFRAKPYLDSGNKWTVGFGHLMVPGDGVAGPGDIISANKATELLQGDVQRTEACVNNLVTVPIEQCQFDALVVFAYNVGCTALRGSTLLRKLNAGDAAGAAQEFTRWDKVNGVDNQGLFNRRIAEQKMFLGTFVNRGSASQ